jgi:hypothetical protein
VTAWWSPARRPTRNPISRDTKSRSTLERGNLQKRKVISTTSVFWNMNAVKRNTITIIAIVLNDAAPTSVLTMGMLPQIMFDCNITRVLAKYPWPEAAAMRKEEERLRIGNRAAD